MNRSVTFRVGFISVLGVVLLAAAAYRYYYTVTDWWFLRSYQPPARVAQLAAQADLTTAGRNMFYRAAPVIVDQRADMVSHCDINDKEVAELGCYLAIEHIYLLNVDEPALRNEMAVTAAYEMLHPVYQRMSPWERNKVNAEMEAVASTITDPDILSQMKIYAKTEPGERDDELYSVLGTEYANLTPALEANYARYLGNRAQLVAYHQQFNQAFDGLLATINQLNSEIELAKDTMQRYEAAGEISRYNALVPSTNAKITEYNNDVDTYDRYGQDILGTQSSASAQ